MRFSSTFVATALLSLVSGAILGKRSLSGEATYYGGNVAGGTCSFSTYTLPSDLFGTALSDSNWDNSANCGRCVSVTGPAGNPITAMIVDECPGCGTNHLDLFPDAFAELATPSTGIINVTWSYVDCPIISPLQLHNKEGVSAYWFSMQVVNANKGVATLEVSTDGGSTWQATERQTYNFFEASSGFDTATVDIRVTSVDGDIVIVSSVGVSSGSSVTASSNFGSSAVSSVASSTLMPTVAVQSSSIAVSTTSIPATTPTPTSTEATTLVTSTLNVLSTFSHVFFESPSSTPTSLLPSSTIMTTPLVSSTTVSLAAPETTVYVDACAP